MTKKPTHRGAGTDRVAKVIARAGLASRREAETMIEAGRVTVNGARVGVATNVSAQDKVAVDGVLLPAPDATRLWLYHKPAGLVTTERDEQGRRTVFDALRPQLGRVLSVGRLDLTSEGLLLLTNDGDLKRRLELPETGWLRRYRVRVNGHPAEAALERLREGIEIEGERFAPMQVTLDRTQGANAWLTVGLREGRNREIRRAMDAVGVVVARLIRISYGPFQLGKLAAGAVEEVKPRILRDQLGRLFDGALAEAPRDSGTQKAGARTETARSGTRSEGKPGTGPRDAPVGQGPRRASPSSQAPKGRPGGKPSAAGGARRPEPGSAAKGRSGPPDGKRSGGKGQGKTHKAHSKGQSSGPGQGKTSPAERQSRPSRPDRRANPSASLRKGSGRGGPRARPPKGPKR